MEHIKTLQYFIASGAPVDLEDIGGYTAFHHMLVHSPEIKFARLLLEKGANPNHRTCTGSTSLMISMRRNSVKDVEFLMEFNVDLDMADADGVPARKMYASVGPAMTSIVER